jgi:nucleotide-binding universal stress UspA family protein
MFQRILVPLDGSPLAEQALPLAVRLAHTTGGSLLLVRSVDRSGRSGDGTAASQYLTGVSDRLRADGLAVETDTPSGDPVSAIAAAALERNADLVVMATHTRTEVARWLHGSVADALLRQGPAPVLIVRGGDGGGTATHDLGPQPAVVVPLDGSARAERALDLAGGLANLTGGHLLLVRAVHPTEPGFEAGWTPTPPLDPGPMIDVEFAEATAYLEQLAQPLRSAGHTVDVRVEVGAPVDVVLAIEISLGSGLVVLSTHGRTGLAHAVVGSVAEGLVHHGTWPALVIPPSWRAPAGEPSDREATRST